MTAGQDDKPSASSKRQRRKIRFHERVQFKTIRHVSEFSEDEIRNGWYDKDDFNRMSDNVSDIAKMIADGETGIKGEEFCTRGLEHIVEEELADYRAEKMINSIDAVLDEQEEQWDEGKEEPGLIAELYAEYAKPLLREAHLIGLKDAEQGYKNWDELLNEKGYQKLTTKPTVSPSLFGHNGVRKTEKVIKAKKTKKVKKSHEEQNKNQITKQTGASSNVFNAVAIGTVKTKIKNKKVKKTEEQFSRNTTTTQHVPASSNYSNTVNKREKEESSLAMVKKKKVERSRSHQNEEEEKDKNSTLKTCNKPSSYTEKSLSSSSLQSSTSSQSSTLPLFKIQGNSSSSTINSCTLKELSLRSMSAEFDTIAETETNISSKGKGFSRVVTKNNTTMLKSKQQLPLQCNEEGKNTKIDRSISPKKQRKTHPRRLAIDRKHGTELSPFVFRRDGTITFRKPDVEKLKREQKEKRKNCIKGSLIKFLHGDEEEENDILAGILSNTNK